MIRFQEKTTTFFLQSVNVFFGDNSYDIQWMPLIQFQETNDDFFLQKSQRLFRRQQLRHSMDAFHSVSGNKRRFFSSKESTSFSTTTATTFNECLWFGFRKQTTIFSLKRVNVFFGDNSYDIQWMPLVRFQKTNDDFFLQKSQRLFRRQQLRHSMDAIWFATFLSKSRMNVRGTKWGFVS